MLLAVIIYYCYYIFKLAYRTFIAMLCLVFKTQPRILCTTMATTLIDGETEQTLVAALAMYSALPGSALSAKLLLPQLNASNAPKRHFLLTIGSDGKIAGTIQFPNG